MEIHGILPLIYELNKLGWIKSVLMRMFIGKL